MVQRWRLAFTIPYVQLNTPRTFTDSGWELALSPIGANNFGAELSFQMTSNTIDTTKAKTYGMEWVQTNLIDSYLLAFGKMLKPEFSDPVLLNESELTAVPRTGYATTSTSAAISLSLPIADVEKSLEFSRRLNAHSHKEQLERSVRWFRKARNSDGPIDQFVTQWIAFNILYNLFNPSKKGDKYAINQLLAKHPSTTKIKLILSDCAGAIGSLASQRLTDWHGLKDYSSELKKNSQKQKVRETLMTTGLCLWVVRNDVFHGGTTPSQNTNLTCEYSQLLDRIYRDCFCGYIGLG